MYIINKYQSEREVYTQLLTINTVYIQSIRARTYSTGRCYACNLFNYWHAGLYFTASW